MVRAVLQYKLHIRTHTHTHTPTHAPPHTKSKPPPRTAHIKIKKISCTSSHVSPHKKYLHRYEHIACIEAVLAQESTLGPSLRSKQLHSQIGTSEVKSFFAASYRPRKVSVSSCDEKEINTASASKVVRIRGKLKKLKDPRATE